MWNCRSCGTKYEQGQIFCLADGDLLVREGRKSSRTGTVLSGKYVLGDLLGQGAMGEVFEATSVETQDPVAVKILKCWAEGAPSLRKRFEIEARAMSALDHAGVTRVLDFETSPDGPSYIVMERLAGASFDAFRPRQNIPLDRCIALVKEACVAVGAAHERQVAHRDLKPSNLFLHRVDRDQLVVKVLDFGMAKILNTGEQPLTITGEILGTPVYMAPEQLRGEACHGPSCDVYSLGVILFQMIAYRLPFEASSLQKLAQLHASSPVPSPAAYWRECPEDLEALVRRCLLKKPENRWQHAGEVADALEAYMEGRSQEGGWSIAEDSDLGVLKWVGTSIDGRYHIVHWMAAGRFGSNVYLAEDTRTGLEVAIRLWELGSSGARGSEDVILKLLHREAKATQVRHPSIISVTDVGFTDDCIYIVTEVVRGVNLSEYLDRRGRIPPNEAAELIRDVASALDAMHQREVASGGLGLETIRAVPAIDSGRDQLLLSPAGVGSLAEIGSLIARSAGEDSSGSVLASLSPEQQLGKKPDARSDIYALGWILLQMIVGKVENDDPQLFKTTTQDIIDRLEAPHLELPPGTSLDPEWRAFLNAALAENPDDRFPTIREFLEAMPA